MLNLRLCILLISFSFACAEGAEDNTAGEFHAEDSKLILSPEDINALIPQIEAAERKLSNIKIESEAWWETKADLFDPCEPWQRTPIYGSYTAWFEGHPKGKARVDVHKEILEWQGGAASYSESSYSVGFDGQYSRVVHYTRGHSGKTFPLKEGRVFADASKSLRTGWFEGFTGRAFSLNFFFSDENYVFSDLFRWAEDPNTAVLSTFEFMREVFQGVQCIKIATRATTKCSRQSWWLDPSRGFALLGHKYTSIHEDGSEQIISSMKVSKLKEVASGIWWPMEVSKISRPYEPGKPYRRFVYRASNVVANDPNFDESIFTVPFPEGHLINDQITGKKYRVGPNGKQLMIPDTNDPNQSP